MEKLPGKMDKWKGENLGEAEGRKDDEAGVDEGQGEGEDRWNR